MATDERSDVAPKNGRLPASELATITGTTRTCRADVLQQTVALRAAFAAHFGKPLVITDGYRTFAEQERLKIEKGVFAATPGTSNHGWGLALDLGSGVNASFTSPEHVWMRENAFHFGYFHPSWAHDHNPSNGQDEPWHWETSGAVPVADFVALVPSITTFTRAGDLPDELTKEDSMAKLARRANGVDYAIVGPGAQFTTLGTVDQLRTAVGLGMVTGVSVADGPGGLVVDGDLELLDDLMWNAAMAIAQRWRDQNTH